MSASYSSLPGRAWALKFISGKYQGGEFPLKDDRQVVVGRSSELDMVLVEDMVSRKHARLVVSGGVITIEDLNSTNGTFVNGEKVQRAQLKEGDRILIGTSILKLMSVGAGAEQIDNTEAQARLEAVAQQARSHNKTSSMSGRIEDIPLPDLLQLFHTSKKNGVLVVSGDRVGKVYLRAGKVFYAVIDENHDLGPAKSFNRIVTWEEGDFELQPLGDEEFMVELDQPTEGLLMDALRQLDEFRRIQPRLPPLDARLSLASPLTAPLRDLNADQLDVLQAVHNHGTLTGVLDNSPANDVTVAEAVMALLQRGYLKNG